MKVWFIRHGESQTNRDNMWTGWFDAALTEKGEQDALKASKALSNLSFDKIYSSDLSRAKRTAEIAIPECVYETSELLREFNVGSLASKPGSIITPEEKAQALKQGFAKYGGESNKEFNRRICEFLALLEKTEHQNRAVFTHAGFMRGLLDVVLDTYISRENIRCDNCAIGVFEYKNSEWVLHSWLNADDSAAVEINAF